MQMKMGMNMMQHQQDDAQAQIPNQIPMQQQQQPAKKQVPEQQNFGYGMQMPQ